MAIPRICSIPDCGKPVPSGAATIPFTQEQLRDLLHYDPETGGLTWKPRPEAMFASPKDAAKWNARFAGRGALTGVNADGYRKGTIWSIPCKAHRVIWIFVHGVEPLQIDHIDGDRLNKHR
jgi:hypothetical protein